MALRKKKTLVDQAGGYVDSVRPRVESALDSAGDFVQKTAIPALLDARDKAGPALSEARDKATPYVTDARDKAAPYVNDARDKARDVAAPYVAQAKDLSASYVAEAKGKAAPIVAAGAAAAGTRAAAVQKIADAKVAELAGPPPKKRSKLKTLLVVLGLAGAAAFVARKLQQSNEDPWQSSYTPTPPPAPAAPPVPGSPVAGTPADPVDDSAGSSPDEALADAAGRPHSATTPDDPAEVVDIDGQHKA